MKTSAKKTLRPLFAAIFCLGACATLGAQRFSSQPHYSPVTAMAYKESTNSVFSAGDDGMVISWNSNCEGDHYQCSDLMIRLLAVHPSRNEIAVYETDDISTYRVTVWDWTYKNRKFSKSFKDSVTCLSYSAQGTYLMVGTSSLKGLNFYYAENGFQNNKLLSDSTGVVTMAKTSRTESSLVVYSPSGQLIYYDLKSGKEKTRFSTKVNLEQPVLYNNNLSFAGFADGAINIIVATSGKTAKTVSAKAPVFCTVDTDSALFYAESDGSAYTVYSATEGETKKVQALAMAAALSAAVKTADGYYFGTRDGDIYQLGHSDGFTISRAEPITAQTYTPILDICAIPEGCAFILTEDSILKIDDIKSGAEVLAANQGFTNIAADESNLFLWSNNTRNPIHTISLLRENAPSERLYTPSSSIQSFKICGEKLVLLEGNSAVTIIDIATRIVEKRFTGTGYLDAELLNGTELYIGKSTATNPKAPMIMVNTTTGETVTLNIRANAAYCLTSDGENLYGQMYAETKSDKTSSLFCYRPESRDYKILWTEKGELSSSKMTEVIDNNLFTDFSQTQITVLNLSNTMRKNKLNGTAQNASRIVKFNGAVYVLNARGTLAAYRGDGTFSSLGVYSLGFNNELYSSSSR